MLFRCRVRMVVAVVKALELVHVSHCTEGGLGTEAVGGD
jgi:hypothetical protein